jgi:hypothetical protein
MKYNNQTPPALINEYINRINSRWKQLNDLLLGIITDGIKYLFYVNAGGCVAVITFIGTSDNVRKLDWPWWVLSLFFIGLIFVGVLNLSRYHVIESLLSNWQKDVVEFYSGHLDFDDMSANDDKRVEKSQWVLWLAYISFACFIGGGAVGFFNYNSLINEANNKMRNDAISAQDTPVPLEEKHIPKQIPVPPVPQPPKVVIINVN